MLSAKSLTSISGSVFDCTVRSMMGESAGFTLRNVGGLGRLAGSWPLDALMAACTSSAAASIGRFRANCSVICALPMPLVDVICDKPAMSENWRSSGCATLDAIVSGLAPGRLARTWMGGKSTWGKGRDGQQREHRGPHQQDGEREQRGA